MEVELTNLKKNNQNKKIKISKPFNFRHKSKLVKSIKNREIIATLSFIPSLQQLYFVNVILVHVAL